MAAAAPAPAHVSKPRKASTASRAVATNPRKAKSTKKPSNPKTAAAAKATVSHPSWKDMIKECIAAHQSEARYGVSRSTIKKFVEEKYKIDMNGLQTSQLNRAIAHGAEEGVFQLPKGPSGKVKLAPKNKPAAAAATKENNKPPPVRKAAEKKPENKKAAVAKVEKKKKPESKKAAVAKVDKKKLESKKAAVAKVEKKKTAKKLDMAKKKGTR